MTDLTVLVSPMPLYPAMKQGFIFGRRESNPVSRAPIMVTLESEIDPEEEADEGQSSGKPHSLSPSTPRKGRVRPPRLDSTLLSPPINTWKSKPRPRHRPTRSQSAPPERTIFKESKEDSLVVSDVAVDPIRSTYTLPLPKPTRSFTDFPTTHGGELLRPPPPLCEFLIFQLCITKISFICPVRPTTFWRKTRKSGVTGPSYSPSSHLIRRSTYIAAGLTFDAPIHDLSALCVESRVGFIVIPPDHQF